MTTSKPASPDRPATHSPRESRTLSRQELALMIFPGYSPDTATQMLSRWIARDDDLRADLARTGFRKRQRIIIPSQARVFFEHFGM